MEIDVTSICQLPDLAARWTDLESRAHGGFFLSWHWIGSWLRTTGAQPLLIEAKKDGVTMALGLVCPYRRRRHLMSIDQLCLHETGLSDFDAVMIEYNNFLIARDAPPDLAVKILQALQSARPDWDEIILGGVAGEMASAAQTAGLHVETDRASPVFGVDLTASGEAPWEETLSSNLRAQLRQSRNFAEREGPLMLEQASDTEQALEFFENLMSLHTAYWQKRNRPGAFATDFSRTFHRELISQTQSQAATELLRLRAGNQTMGYLYNFRYADRIYNYQSGFSYTPDNRDRPGLIAHAMAIGQAQHRKIRVYDFLAGDAHYKARLGQPMGTMIWCRAQKNRPLLRAERAARSFYRRLRGPGAKPAP